MCYASSKEISGAKTFSYGVFYLAYQIMSEAATMVQNLQKQGVILFF